MYQLLPELFLILLIIKQTAQFQAENHNWSLFEKLLHILNGINSGNLKETIKHMCSRPLNLSPVHHSTLHLNQGTPMREWFLIKCRKLYV